jgi:hypothetical protein
MMLRFRNPGTQYSTQIQVIKQLYANLGNQPYFSLEDMATVIAQNKLMTAYGYAGDAALNLSNTDKESMNSARMNAKMYAEVFRMLGWVTPYGDRSYPLSFTYIGIHVALSTSDCSKLYEQCVLGVTNPTELSAGMHYDEKVRIFKCILRSLIDLGGVMYKHELCIGPMSITDDEDETIYQSMISRIKAMRGRYSNLTQAFSQLAISLGMKETPVDNCTRLPIAFMKTCGFVESYTTNALYGKSLSCLKITEHGIDVYNTLKEMKDMRLDEFNTLDYEKKEALIRIGVYTMLQKSGYDISEVSDQLAQDKLSCSAVLKGKELLFSPCQTVRRTVIEEALGIQIGGHSGHRLNTFDPSATERENVSGTEVWSLNVSDNPALELLTDVEDIEFLKEVDRLHSEGLCSHQIVEKLFEENLTAKQATFYPLIATLFKVMGFKCSYSRPGDNGARWDAIIEDPQRSIPIEIKSPTEQQYLSVKAIRQALENKIVLLSRKTHITDLTTTTLAVGYYMPNERAEVGRLISDLKLTYGYRIGVIDLKTLLSIAISIIVDNHGFNKEELYSLEGFANASV